MHQLANDEEMLLQSSTRRGPAETCRRAASARQGRLQRLRGGRAPQGRAALGCLEVEEVIEPDDVAVLDRILRQPDRLPMHSQRLQAAVRARARVRACVRARACVFVRVCARACGCVHACALVRAHARQAHVCLCMCARASARGRWGVRTTCKFRNLSSLISSSDWSKKFLLFLQQQDTVERRPCRMLGSG